MGRGAWKLGGGTDLGVVGLGGGGGGGGVRGLEIGSGCVHLGGGGGGGGVGCGGVGGEIHRFSAKGHLIEGDGSMWSETCFDCLDVCCQCKGSR